MRGREMAIIWGREEKGFQTDITLKSYKEGSRRAEGVS